MKELVYYSHESPPHLTEGMTSTFAKAMIPYAAVGKKKKILLYMTYAFNKLRCPSCSLCLEWI